MSIQRFHDRQIRPYASGDGAISFVAVGRLNQREPGFGEAELQCATGSPVMLADLTAEVISNAIRGDSADNWLIHEDSSGVKLFHRVSRVGGDRIEMGGREYRYSGFGSEATLFAVTEYGEFQDRSGRVNVVIGFLENEDAYPTMKPLADFLRPSLQSAITG